MKITVKFFGELKKLDPKTEWRGVQTVGDIVAQTPGLRASPRNFLVSRNGVRCDIDARVEGGDEILFFPMIAGG